MPLTAQVYVKHPDLALAHTIRALPEVDIEVVSDAGTDPDHDANFFWIEAPAFEAVEATLAEDPTVAEFTAIIRNDDGRTYRITYGPDTKLVSPLVTEVGAIVVESRSHLDGWLLELLVEDDDGLYELVDRADAERIYVDVLDIDHSEPSQAVPDFGLTEAQRETLTAAYLHGYYDEPREAFLEDLAELLDVSRTAVSGRLKRGSANLIEDVLVESEDEE